ncbi:hypothetical protein M885DRAFT_578831 [Pelagophyceae sp. CCMP2097]|nr:hypothetical protein M885DRAFT_578831 [Pelagophyceae sp. CCMP2097]
MEQDPNDGALVIYDPDAAGVATATAPTGKTFYDLFGSAASSLSSTPGSMPDSSFSGSDYNGDLDEPCPVRAVALLRPLEAPISPIAAEVVDAEIYTAEDAEAYALEAGPFKAGFAKPVYEKVGGPFAAEWAKEREAFRRYLAGPPPGDKMAAQNAQNFAHVQNWLVTSQSHQKGNLELLGEQLLPDWTTVSAPIGFVGMQISLEALPDETPVVKMTKALNLRRSMEQKSLPALEEQLGQLSQFNGNVSILSPWGAVAPHHDACIDLIETIKEMGLKIDPSDSWYNVWITSDGKTTNGEHFGLFLLEQSKCEFSYYVAPRPG